MFTRVKASWFHIQAYCEYQLYLICYRKVGNITTPDTLAGDEAHAVLASLPDAGELGTVLADKVYQAQAKYQPFKAREVDVSGTRIYGRIDCIEYHLNHVDILDNKPLPPRGDPFHGDRRQILSYCMAFREQFPDIKMPIIAHLLDYSNKEFWSHEFVEEDELELNETINRMLDIINGTRAPVPPKYDNKCKTCHYLRFCDGTPLKRRAQ